MTRLGILSRALALMAAVAAPQVARADLTALTCEQIVRSIGVRDGDRPTTGYSISRLISQISAIVSGAEAETLTKQDGGFYITVSFGNALFLDCAGGVNEDVYFPVGLVVQGQFSLIHEGVEYVLARTEDGLLLIFQRAWLRRIGPDDIFFVSTDIDRMPLCIAGQVSNGKCDPYRLRRDEEPMIDASSGFVHGSLAELARSEGGPEVFDYILSEHERWTTDIYNHALSNAERSRSQAQFTSEENAEERAYLCRPFNAGAMWERGRRPPATEEERRRAETEEMFQANWEKVTLSLCRHAGEPPPTPPEFSEEAIMALPLELRQMKIITLASAPRRLSPSVSMIFPNASNLSISLLLLAEDGADRAVTFGQLPHSKGCLETFDLERVQEAAGKVGVDLERVGIKLGVTGAINQTLTLTKSYGPEISFRTAALWITEEDRSAAAQFQDVVITSSCKQEVPIMVTTIIIQHPELPDGKIMIQTDELLETYETVVKEMIARGVPGIEGANYGIPSDRSRIESAAEGVFWHLRDHYHYLLWREALQRVLVGYGKLDGPLRGTLDEEERRLRDKKVIDHVADTIMVALFRSQIDPPQLEPETCTQCPRPPRRRPLREDL